MKRSSYFLLFFLVLQAILAMFLGKALAEGRSISAAMYGFEAGWLAGLVQSLLWDMRKKDGGKEKAVDEEEAKWRAYCTERKVFR